MNMYVSNSIYTAYEGKKKKCLKFMKLLLEKNQKLNKRNDSALPVIIGTKTDSQLGL